MKKKLIRIMLSCVLILYLVSTALAFTEPVKFDFSSDPGKLASGELQTFEREIIKDGGAKARKIAGLILINASPAQVWEVLKNWDAMGDYVPDCAYFKTILTIKKPTKYTAGRSFIEGKLDIPIFSIIYTLDVTFDEPHLKQEWKMIKPGEVEIYNLLGINVRNASYGIEDIAGASIVKSYDKGEKTAYYYVLEAEYSSLLPEFIADYISKDGLVGYMKSMKKRVESQGFCDKKDFSSEVK